MDRDDSAKMLVGRLVLDLNYQAHKILQFFQEAGRIAHIYGQS